MKKYLAIAMFSTLLTACSTQVYELNPTNATEPNYEKSQHFFVGGLGQQQELDATSVCHGANNVAKVETKQTFVNGLLSAISYGIYSPREIKVYCK